MKKNILLARDINKEIFLLVTYVLALLIYFLNMLNTEDKIQLQTFEKKFYFIVVFVFLIYYASIKIKKIFKEILILNDLYFSSDKYLMPANDIFFMEYSDDFFILKETDKKLKRNIPRNVFLKLKRNLFKYTLISTLILPILFMIFLHFLFDTQKNTIILISLAIFIIFCTLSLFIKYKNIKKQLE